MQATDTLLRRKTAKSERPVNHGRRKVTISKTNRAAALALLRSIGPVPLPSRK